MIVAPGLPLPDDDQGTALYKDWISGRLAPGAAAEVAAVLAGTDAATGPAPLFRTGWAPGNLTEAGDANLEALRNGRARVVVTGQQPGRLGGPLYTLYKVATAVELARLMTEAGRPAVPVYWSGDADDDHDEAFAPACWNPVSGDFLDLPAGPGRKSPDRRHPMVGRLACRGTVEAEAAWLRERATGSGGVVDRLAALYDRAVAEDRTWAGLQAALVGEVFPDEGILVLSGDDDRLHGTAAPLYETIQGDGPRLGGIAAEAGRALVSRGYHAQIAERTTESGLFADDAGIRSPAAPGVETGRLRPGVLFRSPVQDWLLEPAAVVVGPGELAYLKQLEPLYEHLGIPRAPLVPRLSAWILPCGGEEPGRETVPDPARADAWAADAADAAVARLEEVLAREIGLDPKRAADLAAARGRRFHKGAAAMLRDEARRALSRHREGLPGWVHPRGGRQERILAVGCALGIWGEDLVASVKEAARAHLLGGRQGLWHRYRLDVDRPNTEEGSKP